MPSSNPEKGINDLKSWCLANGEFGKQVMSEWTGEDEYGNHIEINDISKGSHKKVKLKCSKGHEWCSIVYSRTSNRTGCYYCSQKANSNSRLRVGKNDLKTWCLNKSEYGKKLIKEWTGELENGKHISLESVQFGSHRKVKWKCYKGHEWYALIIHRTIHKSGCPYCRENNIGEIIRNSKISIGENDLLSWCNNNGEWGKQLVNEWVGECENGKQINMVEFSYGSREKVKWKCSNGHLWNETIVHRTISQTGYPYCSFRRVSEINSLYSWCKMNNDIGVRIMSEWTGELEIGELIDINEIAKGSTQKVKWKCSKGHEWFAYVYSRTYSKSGCPYCSAAGTSYPEQFIYHSLKQLFPSAENRCKVLKSAENPRGIEFDIGIPDIPLCIEYSPTYWHNDKMERDIYKKEICKKYNVRLIQIIDDSYNELEHKVESDYICFKKNEQLKDEILTEIVDYILKTLGHSISEIDIELAKKKAYENSKKAENDIPNID